MKRPFGLVCALIFAAATGAHTAVIAEASGPDFFRVVGVERGDVLNVRAGPNVSEDKVGELAPDADGIRNLGCTGGLSFAEWEKASEAERAASEKTRWCRIAYAGIEGWAAGRYLAEGSSPTAATSASAPELWKILTIGDLPVEGEPEIGFESDGSFFGATGCNRFQGQVSFDGNRLIVQGPIAMTRMACPTGPLDEQERAILAILESGPSVQFNPIDGEMLLVGAEPSQSARLAPKRD